MATPRSLVLAAGVVLITLFSYAPVRHAQFTNWDDGVYVTENSAVQSFDTQAIFSQRMVHNYHPLTLMSLALDYRLFGLEPAGYHGTNLALHSFNTFLVFAFITLLCRKAWLGLAASYLFGVHPMHVESVAWISSRKDVLYTFFFLLSSISYLAYLSLNLSHAQRRAGYVLTALCFVASALSKPAAVVLPVVLLLIDVYRGRGLTPLVWLEKLPLFVFSVWIGTETILAQQTGGAIGELAHFSLVQRVAVACHGLLNYVQMFLVPVGLSAFHPYPVGVEVDLPWTYTLAPIGVAACAAATWHFGRSRVEILFGAGFFLVNLALVLQFISVGAARIAERYSYLPYLGLSLIAACAVQALWERWREAPILRGGLLGLIGVYVLALPVATYQRSQVWRDSETLWSDAIARYPDAALPRNLRANHLNTSGRHEEALAEYDRAIAQSADYADPHHNRGIALEALGRYEEAVEAFSRSIALDPTAVNSHRHRAQRWLAARDYPAALRDLDRILELAPDDADALWARARVRDEQGHWQHALADARRAAASGAKVAPAYLARLESLAGSPPCAAAVGMERAARALVSGGRAEQIATLEAFARDCDGPAEIWNELAYRLATAPEAGLRDGPRAVELARRALQGIGQHPLVLDTLAAAYAAAGRLDEAQEVLRRAIALGVERDLDASAMQTLQAHAEALEAGRPIRD